MNLQQFIQSTKLDARQIAERSARIHATLLSRSGYLLEPNFKRLHPSDLRILFGQYDREFFDGGIVAALGKTPLQFTLSKRMTSAGGKTVTRRDRTTGGRRYEIGVSVPILFGCFHEDDHRPIVVCGIRCRDRLEALQRVIEHELVHLLEMVLWNESSCSQARFHSITRRFFGHLQNKHQMITPRERAMVKFGIQPGSVVRFRFDGVDYTGVVNRVNKRATVLVEDGRGLQYNNGKRYLKFYIPVPKLEAINP